MSKTSRTQTEHLYLSADGSEGVDHDFAFDTLDRVDNHCHRSRIQSLERLKWKAERQAIINVSRMRETIAWRLLGNSEN